MPPKKTLSHCTNTSQSMESQANNQALLTPVGASPSLQMAVISAEQFNLLFLVGPKLNGSYSSYSGLTCTTSYDVTSFYGTTHGPITRGIVGCHIVSYDTAA